MRRGGLFSQKPDAVAVVAAPMTPLRKNKKGKKMHRTPCVPSPGAKIKRKVIIMKTRKVGKIVSLLVAIVLVATIIDSCPPVSSPVTAAAML